MRSEFGLNSKSGRVTGLVICDTCAHLLSSDDKWKWIGVWEIARVQRLILGVAEREQAMQRVEDVRKTPLIVIQGQQKKKKTKTHLDVYIQASSWLSPHERLSGRFWPSSNSHFNILFLHKLSEHNTHEFWWFRATVRDNYTGRHYEMAAFMRRGTPN